MTKEENEYKITETIKKEILNITHGEISTIIRNEGETYGAYIPHEHLPQLIDILKEIWKRIHEQT